MSVTIVLVIILLFSMVIVGDEKGIKSFVSLCINFSTLFIMLILIAKNHEPIKTTVVTCVIISSITLFYISGFNKKTFAALFSVIIVVLITLLLTLKMADLAKIQGFSPEQADSIEYLSLHVNLDFTKIIICEILIGLISAITDTAITVSSSMNEIYLNNPTITKKELLKSGMNIGRDILGTTINTLLFAYLGGFMALLIWFKIKDYSFPEIINSKVFCSEAFQILCSGIGVVLIIPITAVIAMNMFRSEEENS